MNKKLILLIILVLLITICIYFNNKDSFSKATAPCQTPVGGDPNANYTYTPKTKTCMKIGCKTGYVDVNDKCLAINSECTMPTGGDKYANYAINSTGKCVPKDCKTPTTRSFDSTGKCVNNIVCPTPTGGDQTKYYVYNDSKVCTQTDICKPNYIHPPSSSKGCVSIEGFPCPSSSVPIPTDLNANYVYDKNSNCIKGPCKNEYVKNTTQTCIKIGEECLPNSSNYDPNRIYKFLGSSSGSRGSSGSSGDISCKPSQCKTNYYQSSFNSLTYSMYYNLRKDVFIDPDTKINVYGYNYIPKEYYVLKKEDSIHNIKIISHILYKSEISDFIRKYDYVNNNK